MCLVLQLALFERRVITAVLDSGHLTLFEPLSDHFLDTLSLFALEHSESVSCKGRLAHVFVDRVVR